MRIIEEKDLDLGGLRKLFGKILFYELQEVAWREAVLHGLRIAQRGVDEHQEHVNELLRVPFDFCQPTVRVTAERLPFSHHDGTPDHILLMNVQQSQKVHANQKDEAFYRVGDKSKKLTFDERLQLLYDKGEMVYENKSVFGASLDDIDLQLVQ